MYQTLHSRSRLSRRKGKKEGPITTEEKTKPEKERPTHHLEMEGPNTNHREARANPFREGRNKLHSEGQLQEGPSPHSRRNGEPPLHLQEGRASPHPERERPTPTIRRTGQTQPPRRRANHHTPRRQGQPELREGRVNHHSGGGGATSKKEGPTPTPKNSGEGQANPNQLEEPTHHLEKEGPNTNPEGQVQEGPALPPQEGMANLSPSQQERGANSHPRRKGKPQPKEGRTNPDQQEGRANHHSKGGRTTTARRKTSPPP